MLYFTHTSRRSAGFLFFEQGETPALSAARVVYVFLFTFPQEEVL
jgi:hypothetical protein